MWNDYEETQKGKQGGQGVYGQTAQNEKEEMTVLIPIALALVGGWWVLNKLGILDMTPNTRANRSYQHLGGNLSGYKKGSG